MPIPNLANAAVVALVVPLAVRFWRRAASTGVTRGVREAVGSQ